MTSPTQKGEIKTEHVYPPIPIRSFDWCAWFDDTDEETRRQGWGATEAEAIESLKEMYGLCSHCGKHEDDVKVCGLGGCPLGADL